MNVPWDEILKRLDAMAAKLGVAAGEVWRILVKQAFIDGVTDLIAGLLILIGSFLLGRFAYRHGVAAFDDATSHYDSDTHFWFAMWLGVGTVVTLIAGLLFVYPSITELFNPQYVALTKLFNAMK